MVAVNPILSLLAACAAAASYPKLASDLSEQVIECGSDATDDNRLMAHHLDSLDMPFDASDEINVDTYIHIVAESKEESGGHISVSSPTASSLAIFLTPPVESRRREAVQQPSPRLQGLRLHLHAQGHHMDREPVVV